MRTRIAAAPARWLVLGLILTAMLIIGACSQDNEADNSTGTGNSSTSPSVEISDPGNLLSGGFFARSSADLLGTRNCRGGMCWDYYYFIDDQQVIEAPPPLEGEQVNCSEVDCLAYEVAGDELIIDGKTYTLKASDKGVTIDGDLYARHEPLDEPALDGIYTASGYVEGVLGGGFATTSTLVFRPDGTFLDDRFIGVLTDGSEFGDGTGVDSTHISEAEAAGTYRVINYTIVLDYDSGNEERFLFFRPDLNDRMYKIGGRDFLYKEPSELAESRAEPQKEEEDYRITEPLPDKLVTEGYADKTVIAQHAPDTAKQRGAAEIRLSAYQWAELDIPEAHQEAFTGFGEGPIVALTVQYTITNEAQLALDLASMAAAVYVADGNVTETPALSPTEAGVLAQGESVERLAVFLFPAEMAEHEEQFTLTFSDLLAEDDTPAFQGDPVAFDLRAPYR